MIIIKNQNSGILTFNFRECCIKVIVWIVRLLVGFFYFSLNLPILVKWISILSFGFQILIKWLLVVYLVAIVVCNGAARSKFNVIGVYLVNFIVEADCLLSVADHANILNHALVASWSIWINYLLISTFILNSSSSWCTTQLSCSSIRLHIKLLPQLDILTQFLNRRLWHLSYRVNKACVALIDQPLFAKRWSRISLLSFQNWVVKFHLLLKQDT